MAQALAYFFAALIAALVLTPVCRKVATLAGYVSASRTDRWHQRPTALLGGLAIAVPVVALGLIIDRGQASLLLVAAGALMAAFGLADDLLSLKASTKLIAQVVVASGLLFFGLRLHWVDSMIGDAMLTMIWIVGITNAFNLLDNMDGLCAGTALIAGTFLLMAMVAAGVTGPALYLTVLLGATAGFLVYNRYPASIFLGDAGSLFLGLNLAAVTLIASPDLVSRSGLLSAVAVPVFPLLIPIFDTTLVTAVRLLSGRSPSQGGRDHSSHRLVAVGLSEPRAVATLWGLAALGGTLSLLFQNSNRGWAATAVIMLLIGLMIFGVYLARVRIYDDVDPATLGDRALTPVVADFMYKRRVAEILLDVCLIPLAYYTAYQLRFEGTLFAANYSLFIESLPVVMASQLVALFVVGGYRGTWRHFGMMDAVVFAKGALLGTVAAQMIILYLYRFESYSRTVFIIDAALLLILLCGTRASFRLVGEYILRRRVAGRRLVIYGTGGASLSTIRDGFGPSGGLRIIGYIDDDKLHRGLSVGGYSVLGGYAELKALIDRGEVDCVLLNAHLLAADGLRDLKVLCREREVELLRLSVDLRAMSAAS